MKLVIKAFKSNLKGIKASITVGIDNLVWINGVNIREGKNGDWVSYPSYKSGDEYKDYIMAKKKISETILENYEIGETVEVELGVKKKVQEEPEEDEDSDEFPF